MLLRKAYKFRIYPNQEQQDNLDVQFGHARFVYNRYRAIREGYFLDCGEGLSYRDTQDDLTELKRTQEFSWLKDADSQVLQASLKDLDRAYQNFLAKRASYPRFKSKHSAQSIRYPQRFKLRDNRIYLPKVGWVKVVVHRDIEGKMKNCTVSKTKSGKYFVSIQVEYEHTPPPTRDTTIGIDLGITTYATLSNGDKVDNPRHIRKGERRLRIRQRRLSRKVKGSSNRNKARHIVAVQHERVANRRRDFQRQLVADLMRDYGRIAFETLNVRGMVKNRNLAKAISDCAWGQFVRFAEESAIPNNVHIGKAPTFYASSKLCNDCGEKHTQLKLSDREWCCSGCGAVHDRDHNAAKNIESFVIPSTGGHPESYAQETRLAVAQSAWEAHTS